MAWTFKFGLYRVAKKQSMSARASLKKKNSSYTEHWRMANIYWAQGE